MPDQPATTARKVSDYLLVESRERGELLTNLKLQKLLFYADAWFLALVDRPLFGDRFQAWVHGPVLPAEYQRFRDYKWRAIEAEIERPNLAQDVATHLNGIIDVFGSENATALELMTHREAPWIEARGDCGPTDPCTTYISKDTTKAFYRSL